MAWTKTQAQKNAQKGGRATAEKWARIRSERERIARLPAEEKAFSDFMNADAGIFDGFKMVDVFHERINKNDALIVGYSDDVATAYGVNVGADGVAVYLRDDLQYIIDPQGYTYSRYVMAIDEQTKTIPLADYLDAEQSRAQKDKAFFVPDPISEQVDRAQLAPGEKVTMLQIDPWVVCCTTRRGKIQKAYKTKYAQYNDAAYFEYLPNGARKARYFYVYGKTEFLVYRGDLPEIPREMRETKVGEYMYRANDAGMNAVPFIKKVVEYYAGLGYTPVINTIPA